MIRKGDKIMKAMICEMCGSNDLIKQDGIYVCQHCGTKYTVEEAKKLISTVIIDKTEETKKLLILARRAREEHNSENAEKYYGMVLQADPDNWEAVFFQVYFRAMQCNIGNICNSARSVGNCIESFAALILKVDKSEQITAIKTIIPPCIEISELFASNAVNHYNKYMTVDGAFSQCVDSIVSIHLILGKVEIIIKNFTDDKNILMSFQKYYINYLTTYSKFFDKNFLSELITRLSNEIHQTDPSFNSPSVNTGGCYIATAIYGSYDCPEVWTLRRFRDNILSETWYGRLFIHMYYKISPVLVRQFGDTTWFKSIWKPALDKFVKLLNDNGICNTKYDDKNSNI